MADRKEEGRSDSFSEADARQALAEACGTADIAAREPGLIRMGSNAVFRVDSRVIARVGPTLDGWDGAVKQIRVARWLEGIDYPAVRATPIDQPIAGDGRVVTFWVSIAPETEYAPIEDVAELIKRLHDLAPPRDLTLPLLCPFGPTSDPLPVFGGLSDDDAEFLRSRVEWARTEFPSLPFELPSGVIHGDANVGNVLVDSAGQAVLIDLDSFAIGPREWDLIQTALFYDRLGWHTREEYKTFVDVYGFDIMEWAGYADLADMREIAMTSWLSKKAGDSESAAREASKRIRAIRSGGSRRDWGAY